MPDARTGLAPLADLSPANFAIVMATGMLGVAAHQQGHEAIAGFMLVVCALAWPLLVVLSLARLARHRGRMLADLCDHQRAPGFLTTVAGTCVLGSLLAVLGFGTGPSMVLGALGCTLWLVLTYAILMALTVGRNKPLLAGGISGAWLLTVVATQSMAVLAALLAPHAAQPARLALNFGALSAWLCGGMLYVWVISLIFYRLAFFGFSPQDLTPTYWINMGAMAISALAGGLLVVDAAGAPFLQGLLPFVKGGTVLYWAVGTWWIPLLLALIAWRLRHGPDPWRYDVAYWGAVFPLGMYSAATYQMSQVLELQFLLPLARAFFWLAVVAWLLTALGLARHLLRVREGARAAAA